MAIEHLLVDSTSRVVSLVGMIQYGWTDVILAGFIDLRTEDYMTERLG
jgi:hypothetical protein